mmetsp:Transcript_13789/g.34723  ORF Transcript_13789/g.34723 Transcript_13789/m.34723 type:complete len:267 (+) Transcript_13789:2222-3022(+)
MKRLSSTTTRLATLASTQASPFGSLQSLTSALKHSIRAVFPFPASTTGSPESTLKSSSHKADKWDLKTGSFTPVSPSTRSIPAKATWPTYLAIASGCKVRFRMAIGSVLSAVPSNAISDEPATMETNRIALSCLASSSSIFLSESQLCIAFSTSASSKRVFSTFASSFESINLDRVCTHSHALAVTELSETALGAMAMSALAPDGNAWERMIAQIWSRRGAMASLLDFKRQCLSNASPSTFVSLFGEGNLSSSSWITCGRKWDVLE